jgi:hypothetical protein
MVHGHPSVHGFVGGVHGISGGAWIRIMGCTSIPQKSDGWAHQKAFPISHIYPFVEIMQGLPMYPCTVTPVLRGNIRTPPEHPCTPSGNPCNTCTDTSPGHCRASLMIVAEFDAPSKADHSPSLDCPVEGRRTPVRSSQCPVRFSVGYTLAF